MLNRTTDNQYIIDKFFKTNTLLVIIFYILLFVKEHMAQHQQNPLTPHTYPIWITIPALLTAIAWVYFIIQSIV